MNPRSSFAYLTYSGRDKGCVLRRMTGVLQSRSVGQFYASSKLVCSI